MKNLTVDELINELQKFSEEGYGDLPVIDGDNDCIYEAIVTFVGDTNVVQIW